MTIKEFEIELNKKFAGMYYADFKAYEMYSFICDILSKPYEEVFPKKCGKHFCYSDYLYKKLYITYANITGCGTTMVFSVRVNRKSGIITKIELDKKVNSSEIVPLGVYRWVDEDIDLTDFFKTY